MKIHNGRASLSRPKRADESAGARVLTPVLRCLSQDDKRITFNMGLLMKRIILLFAIAIISLLPTEPALAVSQKAISAKAAIVMDDAGSVLFAKHPGARLAPASTVKLMTAMVALDNLDPEKKVKISKNAARVRSIKPRIRADEEMTVSDLLHLALMKSINASAVALAEATSGSEQEFVTLMNKKAAEIGAKDTLFANASGLPTKGRQYTTAGDLVLILKHALTYPLIREILGKKEYLVMTSGGRVLFLESTNNLLWRTDDMIGGKTGYTGTARHCFVGAINTEKGPLFTAVLGARSRSSLWKNTLKLAEIGFQLEPEYKINEFRVIPVDDQQIEPLSEVDY
ncbi:MAG TPA: D-alanyl-D-alanine carboxypeptidase family protein [Nitrospirota bacterium]|nr:D-alanyl-D-alanine carboxypeptidase family protein [Nitrospirota bacterium]